MIARTFMRIGGMVLDGQAGGASGVSCSHPGAIIPDDLIAYIDGEASASVIAHLRECPDCAAEAEVYAAIQRQLQRRLFRLECPSAHTLGEYELGVVAPDVRAEVAAHLVLCPRCRDELDALRAFFAVEPVERPTGVVETVRRLAATLLAPLSPTPATASLRGGEDAGLQVYAANDVRITLSVEGLPERPTSLLGLLWRENDDPAPMLAGTATLVDLNNRAYTTTVDEAGNFTFEEIIPGSYRLEVALDDELVTIDRLPIGL
jgi:hypothetical protein